MKNCAVRPQRDPTSRSSIIIAKGREGPHSHPIIRLVQTVIQQGRKDTEKHGRQRKIQEGEALLISKMADAMEVDQAKPQRFQVKKVRPFVDFPSSPQRPEAGEGHSLGD